ncbi:MAG: sigma-70 family RNA polymerase sigma factor [Clostridia bacterium]|nr:sigma-70 family RNA polymerase sigma factor [Clostridia bacterium]
MNNRELIKIVKEIKNQNMTHFGEMYAVFDRLIKVYGARIEFEDAVEELTVFLLELIYDIDIDRFKPDNSDALCRYIAVSLRNKYIILSKKADRHILESCELLDYSGAEYSEQDTKIALADGLRLLSDRQRQAVVARYIYGFSDAEIAEKLNITRQAVHGLELRALSILRRYYGEML